MALAGCAPTRGRCRAPRWPPPADTPPLRLRWSATAWNASPPRPSPPPRGRHPCSSSTRPGPPANDSHRDHRSIRRYGLNNKPGRGSKQISAGPGGGLAGAERAVLGDGDRGEVPFDGADADADADAGAVEIAPDRALPGGDEVAEVGVAVH